MRELHSTDFEKPVPCPSCGEELEASTYIRNAKIEPTPGDISICFTCGAVNQFTEDLKLKACDIDKLPGMPAMQKAEIRRVCAQVKAMRLARKGN